MGILNYTTKIPAEKTAGEIQEKLAKAKAKRIMSEYDEDGILVAMSFQISIKNEVTSFRLPINVKGVFSAIANDKKIPNSLKTYPQASRVAWRIMKDWVEAQLAIVESNMVDIREVFFSYMQVDGEKTVYDVYKNKQLKEGE